MSNSSDSDEFFDAEDLTPNRSSRKSKSCIASHVINENDSGNNAQKTEDQEEKKDDISTVCQDTLTHQADKDDIEKRVSEAHRGRHKFRELRQRMQTEDEDVGPNNTSPPDSQTSSVEGIFAAPAKTSHPFRIIEHDALSLQSMTSLGRVGRILGGVVDPSVTGSISRDGQSQISSTVSGPIVSKDDDSVSDTSSLQSQTSHMLTSSSTVTSAQQSVTSSGTVSTVLLPVDYSSRSQVGLPLQEPDVIASTKSINNIPNSNNGSSEMSAPVAPPRRKKKCKIQTPCTLSPACVEESYSKSSPLPSPASTIESLTREFEHSLDIRSATKGQYVVKPQDEDGAKAEGPSEEELKRLEKLKAELLSSEPRKFHVSGSPMSSMSSNSIGRNITASHKLGVSPRGSKERRRSAGDEQGMMSQLNMLVRTRTDSGKQLSDLEILEQVTVLNLDTGERVPLSIAEDKLPQCINPLSLHIMRLTSEYVSNSSLEKEKESDEESVDSKKSSAPPEEDTDISKVKRRTAQIKKFFGSKVKKTMDKAKFIAQEVTHARHKDDVDDIGDDVTPGEQYIKLKVSGSHKGPYEFDSLQHVQDLSGEHAGPVWCMKFSSCGRLLATAGQDRVLRIWVVRNAYTYFQDMRTKYNAEKVSPTPSQESLVSQHSSEDPNAAYIDIKGEEGHRHPFMPKPFCTYTGHTSDLLDVSWSKNYFVLSSSMDKTVRLWHISRKECLCCFQHIDFVTAIVFHPRDDRYFLSGSLDGKLRLWNIPDKKVAVWNEVDGQTKLITAANFCQNGKFAVVGSYDGLKIFAQYIGFTKSEIKSKLQYSADPFIAMMNLYNSRGGTPEEFTQGLYAVSRDLRNGTAMGGSNSDRSRSSRSGGSNSKASSSRDSGGPSNSRALLWGLRPWARANNNDNDDSDSGKDSVHTQEKDKKRSWSDSKKVSGGSSAKRRKYSDISETVTSSSDESSDKDEDRNTSTEKHKRNPRKLSDKDLWKISAKIASKDWRNLGRTLGIEEQVLQNLNHAHQSIGFRECTYQMLLEWKGRKPRKCTFGELYTSLINEGMVSVAKHVVKQMSDRGDEQD